MSVVRETMDRWPRRKKHPVVERSPCDRLDTTGDGAEHHQQHLTGTEESR